uniref:T9SS type A sorting domain-containing protein n=1 Tax=Psychroflexus aestuariivivens TaxID=1795040 RepID=UPI001300375B
PQDGEELSLALYNYEHSNYTFKADLSNFGENMTVYLNDNYTNSLTELDNGLNHIDFSVDSSIPESIAMTRFSISFENTTLSITDENFENFSVYPNPVANQQFTIQTSHLAGEDVDLKLFNISGQIVMLQSLKLNSNGALNVQSNQLSSGVYILELTQGKQSFKEKLIIK